MNLATFLGNAGAQLLRGGAKIDWDLVYVDDTGFVMGTWGYQLVSSDGESLSYLNREEEGRGPVRRERLIEYADETNTVEITSINPRNLLGKLKMSIKVVSIRR
jgi:hypothetical protein